MKKLFVARYEEGLSREVNPLSFSLVCNLDAFQCSGGVFTLVTDQDPREIANVCALVPYNYLLSKKEGQVEIQTKDQVEVPLFQYIGKELAPIERGIKTLLVLEGIKIEDQDVYTFSTQVEDQSWWKQYHGYTLNNAPISLIQSACGKVETVAELTEKLMDPVVKKR